MKYSRDVSILYSHLTRSFQDIISWNIEFYYMQKLLLLTCSRLFTSGVEGWNINSYTFFLIRVAFSCICTWQQCRVVGNVSAGVWWCIYISMKILKAFHERGRKEALSWQAEWSEDKLSTIKKKWRKKNFFSLSTWQSDFP